MATYLWWKVARVANFQTFSFSNDILPSCPAKITYFSLSLIFLMSLWSFIAFISWTHVVGARQLAKTVCRSFMVCRKATHNVETQQMGQLPAAPVNPSVPFFHNWDDFVGPFVHPESVFVKTYLCVFVCFSTKATHLEIVSDLTTLQSVIRDMVK